MTESERSPLLGEKSRNRDTHVTLDGDSETDGESAINRRQTFRSGSVLDVVEPINLSWQDVNVYVKPHKKFCGRSSADFPLKHLLRNVNGLLRPGTLTALMGASGAGKSTLMNVLTGRNVSQYIVEGSIKVNGALVGRSIKNISAYVQQHELLFGTLTVREHLIFRALLRMDKSLNRHDRMLQVEDVIVEMGLSKCADTLIGSTGGKKGISGGEMKRLSFASEVLSNPPLMFCDEPTSGIDTFMAQSVVSTLQNMAKKGRTILCTIHQPSSEVFAMFSEVLLMAEGRIAFKGTSKDAFKFFEDQGYPCPVNFNPADFYVLTLAIVPNKEEESRERVESLCNAYDNSDVYSKMIEETRTVLKDYEDRPPSTSLFTDALGERGSDRYEASWCVQFRTVFWRSWVGLFRDVMLFKVRLAQTLVLGILLGIIYLRLNYDQAGVMNINGAIFLIMINASFTGIFSVINTFPLEVAIFLRDYGSGLYRSDVYFLSKSFAELPSFIVLPFLFTAVTYWMMGLYESWQAFLICCGTVVFVANVSSSFSYVIGTLCSSVNLALSIAPPLLIPIMLFGGFFLNNASVPDYFIWLKYLSWLLYANEILVINQWQDVDYISCPANNASVPNGTAPSGGQKCFRNGNDVIESLNFDKDNVPVDFAALGALLVGCQIISFIILFVRARLSQS